MSDDELPLGGHDEPQSRSATSKRRRNAEEEVAEYTRYTLADLGSQQSIMKWIRHVPGPLQDVMKKRADQLDSSMSSQNVVTSANSDGFTVTLVTVFDQGPWVDMCQYLGMATTPGKPTVGGRRECNTEWCIVQGLTQCCHLCVGGVKMSGLKCTVQSIVEDDQAVTKTPELLVLIKSVRYVDEEIVAVLHDPTGEIEGYFHRELVDHLGPALVAGAGILLYKVSVFTPTEAPITGRRKSYLNITPRNVRRVFVTKDQSSAVPNESAVEQFNNEKEIEAGQESDNDDYDENMASSSEQAARQLLQHRNVRDTSAELTFLSQRQVIHRNPPVRVDPDVAVTTMKKKGKRGKGATANQGQEEGTGLGRWQWSKLLKKNNDDNGDESNPSAQGRQGFLDASSRLVSLISKQNSRNRLSTSSVSSGSAENNRTLSSGAPKLKNVHFAPGTAFDPPRSPRNWDNRDVTDMTPSSLPSNQPEQQTTSVVVGPQQPVVGGESISDEDDDDDCLKSYLQHIEAMSKDLDARLRVLQAKTVMEEGDWVEQGRKLFEFEDKFLRDTLLEGNILTGWGEPRTAPVRFRNAGVRKRKRERQEAAAERTGKPPGPSTPTLSNEEQLKVDRHRLASYSSVESPAEPLRKTLEERERKLVEARSKKAKKPTTAAK